jgi:translation initiation factor IF-2
MRARGAKITDIAILVVAADDEVMPQTIEAISHAKAANVPIIVAINKIDKPEANIERVKQELAENGVLAEDWGGDTIMVPVSAKNKIGIEDLLEMVLLVAEMQELKANPNRKAVGTIIEAQLDKGKGPVATVLVQKGTLNVGDMVVSGTASGRIRAMFDDKGKKVKKATPSIPVMIIGLSEVPNAGEMIYAVENEKIARHLADLKKNELKEQQIKQTTKVSLDDLFERIKQGELKELNLIIKADVRGSIEALSQSVSKLETDEVRVNIIHSGVGGISESDVMLASASNALVIGFNVRPNLNAIEVAKKENVDIRTYRVIYEAIEDIQAAIKGMHAPKIVEEVLGRATVRATFRLPNGNSVAGIYVLNGKITRNSKIRLLRYYVVIYDGAVSSL